MEQTLPSPPLSTHHTDLDCEGDWNKPIVLSHWDLCSSQSALITTRNLPSNRNKIFTILVISAMISTQSHGIENWGLLFHLLERLGDISKKIWNLCQDLKKKIVALTLQRKWDKDNPCRHQPMQRHGGTTNRAYCDNYTKFWTGDKGAWWC